MHPFKIESFKTECLSQNDPVLGALIAVLPPVERFYDDRCFIALISAIVYQQISISAGNAIWNRLEKGIGDMTPEQVLQVSIETLRGFGLSGAKAHTVHAIADGFTTGFLSDEFLKSASNAAIIQKLIQIKGIGTWTAEMFLMFSLGREDIFSFKDLGLRNGIQWLYGLDASPTEAFVDQLVKLWHPYTTLAAFYLWEITLKALGKTDRDQTLGPLAFDVTHSGIGQLDTPIGSLTITCTLQSITDIQFGRPDLPLNETPLIRLAKRELDAYFKGTLKTFSLPLAKKGTAFQQAVYAGLHQVPYGETKSYGEIAQSIGIEKASRAVGNANNKNPLPILVPCHRIVGSKGQLVGYAGGLDKKVWLLEHESNLK